MNAEEIEEIGIDLPPKVVQVSISLLCVGVYLVHMCVLLYMFANIAHTIYPHWTLSNHPYITTTGLH